LERRHKALERGTFLKLAQSFGVGRRYVHRDVARIGVYGSQAGQVIVCGEVVRRIAILADVEAQNSGIRPRSAETRSTNVGKKLIDAVVVKPEAVDQGLHFWHAKNPRLGISALRPRSHRAAFDEPETEGGQAVDVKGFLFQSRGEPT